MLIPLDKYYKQFHKHLLIIFVVLIVSHKNLYSQFLGSDLLSTKENVTIPFQLIGGFIIIDIKYNNIIPQKYIFDTGAANTILFDKNLPDIFNVKYSDTIKIVGADINKGIDAYIARNGNFELTDLNTTVKRDYIILAKDYLNLEKSLGVKIGGILGADFFKRLTVKIDYCKKTLVLSNPDFTKIPKNYTKLIAKIINGKPYINAIINLDSKPYNLRLLLDTGASTSIIINKNTENDIVFPDGLIHGYLGSGLSGNILGHLGIVQQLTIGEHNFNNIIGNFQNTELDSTNENITLYRNGLLGSTILSRFNIIIDYIQGFVYLKPNKDFDDKFKVDKSGLVLHAFGEKLNQFVIHYVYPDSPASGSGLKKGDVILKFQGCKSANLRLDQVSRKLQGKNGKIIALQILRDNVIMEKQFNLRPLITKKANN